VGQLFRSVLSSASKADPAREKGKHFRETLTGHVPALYYQTSLKDRRCSPSSNTFSEAALESFRQ